MCVQGSNSKDRFIIAATQLLLQERRFDFCIVTDVVTKKHAHDWSNTAAAPICSTTVLQPANTASRGFYYAWYNVI